MLLSKRTVYGIRAALLMASQRGQASYLPAREISSRLGISYHYLPKVLQELTRAGITQSLRGPNGGVALARSPGDITLTEIIAAIEGHHTPVACPLADEACSTADPCEFCRRWSLARNHVDALFDETTLADVRRCTHVQGKNPSSGTRNPETKKTARNSE